MHKATVSGTNGSFTTLQQCALIQLSQLIYFPPPHTLYLGPLAAFATPELSVSPSPVPVYMLLHTVTYTHVTCIHLCSRAGERQKFQSRVFTSQYYFFSSPQSSFCFFQSTFSQRFSATLLQIQKLYFSSGYLEAI